MLHTYRFRVFSLNLMALSTKTHMYAVRVDVVNIVHRRIQNNTGMVVYDEKQTLCSR